MKRKLMSVLAILLLLINLITVTPVKAVGERVTIAITPDKTEVKPGDTITYTVSFEMSEPCYTMQVSLDIPEGLTYVPDSGKIDSDLAAKLDEQLSGFAIVEFAEASKSFLIGGDTPFVLNGNVVIGTFQCTVDNTSEGEYAIALSHVQVADENAVSIPDTERNIILNPVKVIVSVTGISLNLDKATINVGETETLVALLEPNNASNQNIDWSSDDTSVATVNASGVVSAIKPGNATITATSKDGNYKATCYVTVVCPHSHTTIHPAQKSTCIAQGNEEYTTCDDCGVIIAGNDQKLPLADHQYGDLIPEVGATHTETELINGTKAHYECTVCHKLFDENKEEVTQEDLVIVATHQYGDWTADTADHWKECGCGNIIDLESHKGGTATCKDQATCEICGVKYGKLDTNNHTNTEIINVKPATCTEKGYTGDTYCKDCQNIIKAGADIAPTGHKGGEATCKEQAICEVCNTPYGKLNPDNHVNTELINAKPATCTEKGYTGDTYCKDCQNIIKAGADIAPTGHKGGEATCKEQAICEICSTPYGELNPNNHINTELKNVVEATTEKEGYTGDIYCKDCGALVKEGEVIPVVEENPQETTNNNEKETTDPTRPQTDDISNIYLWISLLVISGICFIVIAKCKTKRRVAKH